jgi:hypothetical protein
MLEQEWQIIHGPPLLTRFRRHQRYAASKGAIR